MKEKLLVYWQTPTNDGKTIELSTAKNGIFESFIHVKAPGKHKLWACKRGARAENYSFFTLNVVARGTYGACSESEARNLSLGSLNMITHMASRMGSFYAGAWDEKYEVARASGYNAVHLTPVEKLSDFGSAYAVRSVDELNPHMFGANGNWDDLETFTSRMFSEKGVISVADVVPNHCSTESELLREYPNICVNLENHPHLR